MRYLLDTHVLLWWVMADRRLSAGVREILAAEESDIAVSAASLWEIAIKRSLGRIDVDFEELLTAIVDDDFVELPVRFAHTKAVQRLPRHHDDPFDRLLIAQAIVEERRLVTRDGRIDAYAGTENFSTVWR